MAAPMRSCGQSHQAMRWSASITSSGKRIRMTRAGLPATMANGGTSRVTTAPAPTAAPVPIVRPGSTMAPS